MFTNFEHFKKATQEVFRQFKAQPNLKLSEFRQSLTIQAGFNNLESYKASLDTTQNKNNARIQVVSVIVQDGENIIEKEDFIDNAEGNQQAEVIFCEKIRHYHVKKGIRIPDDEAAYFEASLDDGYTEIGTAFNHQFMISIMHTTF